ncbi:unnamed protein product [Clonostachys rosea]|uniref:GrpB domain protein n=1 Tax=Bionectria ochroleuca TaxID=29856 RepID=A0ABY6USX6_BIOOC|nr:unnamed protein product [Clonostachys rosea]
MAPSIEDILGDYKFDESRLERISFRKAKPPLEIVPPNPAWPQNFETFKARIVSALGDKAIEVHHTGSTSIPGLPAKDIIDIDLVVPDNTDEPAFVPALEAVGFQFLTREPHWFGHRFFCGYEPLVANLHVWSPGCPEVERHRIFREWLLEHPEDKELYVKIKEESSKVTREKGGLTMDYNLLKENTIREILRRAFKALGYLDEKEGSAEGNSATL